MAEGNLSVVAGRILKLLGSEEDIQENRSLSGVPHELLQGLQETISKLTPLLLDAEKKSRDDDRVKDWLVELEDVLYNVDNLLAGLSTKALRRSSMITGNKIAKQVRSCFLSSSRLENVLEEIINKIAKRLDKIAAQGRDLLHLEECTEKQVMTLDKKAIVKEEEEVAFRDYDKLKIIKLLLDLDPFNKRFITVLPIVGRGGMGKTALAKDVFNDEMIQSRFNTRIWVSVSENYFDIKQILTDIVVRASNQTVGTLESMELLTKRTRDLLHGKLCFIVFDDVCNEDKQKWSSLMDILGVGAMGSKIIVTTRSVSVALITGTLRRYMLGTPSEQQSWLLFKKVAFGKEPKSSYQIKVGKEIVKKCEGHLVCVKTIASMLRLESSEAEWRFFYKNEFCRIWKDIVDKHLSLINLCYDHLHSPLKHCFAYCSLFPKDHEYDVETMIKLWMAQGFIIDQPGKSLEDVGYEYVLDLLRRSFFQAAEVDVRERVTKFRMNGLMLDLAISVAGDQCRMLSPFARRDIVHARRTSHVSIDIYTSQSSTDFDTFLVENIRLCHRKKMRSIVLLRQSQQKCRGIPGNEFFYMVTYRFRFLRALDMHAFGIKVVPTSIDNLKLLKYLDLSGNEDIAELPNSITKLLNLQTLRLSSCFGLKKLPRDLKNLINLRHLEIDGCYNLTSLPRGISQLPNLQILSQLVVSEETSPNIGLNTLRKEVHIKNLGHENFAMDKYLNVVPEVQSLSLEWESYAVESDEHKAPLNSDMLLALEELTLQGFWGRSLFSSGCPSNLVKLSLRRCVNCEILPPIDQLLNLKVLVLDEITKLEYISDNASSTRTFFPSLQELWLTELPELQGWWRNGVNEFLQSFPCISKLVIEDCPKLDTMPLFPTLEEGLVLDTTSWKPFQRTMDAKTVAQEEPSSSSSSPSPPLYKLKALRIVGVEDFKADEVKWETLSGLRFLRFDCLPNLDTLPEGLQQVTSLQELHLWRCGIEEIPEWIGKLQNLEKLGIRICPLMKSLPKAINELQFLETLEIEECDTLLQRCKKDIGADWEKISSIKKPLLGQIYKI